MLDSCDAVICYVDNMRERSGANKALAYAKKKGLKITNIYRKWVVKEFNQVKYHLIERVVNLKTVDKPDCSKYYTL